jgi:hypothetical protein
MLLFLLKNEQSIDSYIRGGAQNHQSKFEASMISGIFANMSQCGTSIPHGKNSYILF